VLAQESGQYRRARRPGAQLREHRRDRAGESKRWHWYPRPSTAIPRSRPLARHSRFAEQAQSVGPIAELEQKVAANPLDHQARFDLAVALNSKGQRQEAVDNLLAIVKRDRKWNDDGARKQLVQFFEAWGPTD
jgi:thioredoxin-like negative regulator of GroEL